MRKIRWGIVGTGNIAHRFAKACRNTESSELAAVASRKIETANGFADEFDIPLRFDSYEEMAQSNKIDAAYIATPHGLHAENAILFMNNKKAVLSEKPIALNSNELNKMIDCAKKNQVFLMEAMWARMVPGTKSLIKIVESGVIGKVKGIQGSFCYNASGEREHAVFNPKYGGGSLLDVGCYGLSFASWYSTSRVESINAVAQIGPTGVDEHCCILIKYEDETIASISSATTLNKPNEGYLFGEKGYVYVERFYAPEELKIFVEGKEPETITCPYIGNGFEEQILEANNCIRNGVLESSFVPHSQSLFIMNQMDTIRKQINLKYPCD